MVRLLLIVLFLFPAGATSQTREFPQRERRVVPRLVQPAQTVVPELIGRNLVQAERILAGRRLRLGEVSRQESDASPGTIINQEPEAGIRVPVNTEVGVVVAIPPQPGLIRVPDVRGRPVEEAEAILAENRLRIGEVRPGEPGRRPGTVIEQRPSPGIEVDPGTPVDLVLAAEPPAPAPVVPDLIGRSLEEARELLAESRLRVGNVEESASDSPPGTVVRQRPEAGTEAQAGTAVNLVLATAAPSRSLLPFVAIGLLALLAVLGASYLRRKKTPLPPSVEIRPQRDPGAQSIQPENLEVVESAFGLRAFADPGEQRIDGDDSLLRGGG